MSLSDEIEELLEDIGGLTSSGGAGFGYRDIQVSFKNNAGQEEEIENVITNKLEEHNIKIGTDQENQNDAYLSIYDEEENA